MELSFNSICRTCMTETAELSSIYENDVEEKLKVCCELQIWYNDGLPENICALCASEVEQAYSFREKCKRSDSSLRNILLEKGIKASSKVEIKTEPDLPIEYPEIEFIEDFADDADNASDFSDTQESSLNENSTGKFHCLECPKRFKSNKALKRHLTVHTCKTYECDVCCKSYNRLDRLRYHMKTHEEAEDANILMGKPMFECDKCGEHFLNKKLIRLHFFNSDCAIKFECSECKKIFSNARGFRRHLEVHSGVEFACHLCDKKYTRVDRLSSHLKEHLYGKIKSEQTKIEKLSENSDESEGEIHAEYEEKVKKTRATPKFQCALCNVRFASEKFYRLHTENNKCNNESYVCSICNTVFSGRKALKNHGYNHRDEKFPCEMCDRVFNRPDFLRIHQRQEHKILTEVVEKKLDPDLEPNEAGMYACKTCGLVLKNRRNLKRHFLTHAGIKFKCKMCDKEYNRRYVMNQHMKEVHGIIVNPSIVKKVEEEKLDIYTCETCQKTFTKRYKYKEHLQIHSDFLPFLCNLCGQSFKTKKSFQYHEMRHSNVRPYKCEQCTKAYFTNKELIVHIRSHTGEKPYVCADCGSAYTHADSLTNHRRLHTGERPFKCDFCPKSFIKSERLKRHRRIHTGERPYACSYCESRFTQKYDCVKHERRHQEHQQLQQPVATN